MINNAIRRIATPLLLIALSFTAQGANNGAPAQSLASQLSGEFSQGGIIVGQYPAGSKVTIGGRLIRPDSEGFVVYGFDRDAPAEVALVVETADGNRYSEALNIAQRQYRVQKIEGIKRAIMSPSEEDLSRIRGESKQIRVARKDDLDLQGWRETFQWPITGPITGVFGSQRVYNGVPSRPHYGVDVAAPVGANVAAPASGKVTLAHADMFYSGGTVIIDHGHGLSSSFLHLSKVHVKVGQRVEQGDLIAEVGATGRATGPHLDWRMNWFDQRVDPEFLVGPMPEQ
jgi:murein DD-endopeptidase MepM/ murein hydrolase activator NlpD